MSLQQDMMNNTDDGLSASRVELVQYPILNPATPPAQYVQMNDAKEAIPIAKQEPETSRETFLVEYYKKILRQHLSILGMFTFGLMEWFANIVVDFGYYYNTFRWTFYTFVVALIIIALGLPITRSLRTIVKHQNSIFYLQTILIGFVLIGIGNENSDTHATAINWWIIITLIILIAHSIAQIVLVKHNITHYYTMFMKFAIMGSITLNFVVGLCASSLDSSFPVAEAIIIYSIYYFNQLNEHLLKNSSELPEDVSIVGRIQIINKIQALFNQEAQSNQVIEQIKETHCVVNRYIAIVISSAVAYLLILILSIVTGNALFIVIVVVVSISLLSVVLNTQVASRTLQQEDVTYAVCLTYLDLASPLKNILRGIISN
ncbi:unnamed protein product (macronuclear) [Paramecium tetraurelia]|uniref:Transmembrane protein n=1 Tax=Paramecium tetraurelia TaxID=5888 RepID=A0DMJ2_PARTE|nr:uncharacterized protein GSPATT00018477001 [Paramecium tetraurelia]CAK84259.1 unnamed protein product [Paramecium tetraurelia]|eukprot:XP_001451656.1 hypothetical protein (macronuclear) [Paramecium tetraurelia strain d4-2]